MPAAEPVAAGAAGRQRGLGARAQGGPERVPRGTARSGPAAPAPPAAGLWASGAALSSGSRTKAWVNRWTGKMCL